MKTLFPILLGLFLAVASMASAGTPSLNVTVSDAGGKLAFKGATKNDGGFATGKLQPGNYVVQFSSKNAALKGGQYSIIVAAGQKKVVANSIAGDKFLGGGVAMKVQVGAGSDIIGHVSAGPLATNATQKDSVGKMQDRAQDQHQEGFHSSLSNTQDKMTRPGN
ncbi:MAG TPA: T9SS type A sorting domain-containing protein [Chthoniobacterales bacterium]|nr:T9SS type A sorting domain-containing protein [Chthoniobacterales bacterium]